MNPVADGPPGRWADLVDAVDMAAYRKGDLGRRMGLGTRPAMLVIDMTYLFVDPRYPTAYGERGWAAVAAWARLLPVARERGVPIFYSRRGPRGSAVDRGVTDLKWGFTEDALWLRDARADDWPPEIAPQPGDTVVQKWKPSAFFETPLRSMLTYLGVDSLVIGGISTSGCVRCAVTDAFSSNFRVVIPEECCADRSIFSHRASLFDMDMKFADVEPLEGVIAELRALSAQKRGDAA